MSDEPSTPRDAPSAQVIAFLVAKRLLEKGGNPTFRSLTGGVSSEIWYVETARHQFCVKRPLEKLRVAADWSVSIERGCFEAAWLENAARFVPEAVPKLLAHDPTSGTLAMEYLPPERHRLWKSELFQGNVDPEFSGLVGRTLGRLHSAFARDRAAALNFSRDDLFYSLRLEPYLEATGRRHPHLASRLQAISDQTVLNKNTVVHGDVSPKNILLGKRGPVFLDAECAWFGDPAFDLAFCLNHLLLKSLVIPEKRRTLISCFLSLQEAYLKTVDWEHQTGVNARAASLLPALLLARVDGKSPVEYISNHGQRGSVRRLSIPFILTPTKTLSEFSTAWTEGLSRETAGG